MAPATTAKLYLDDPYRTEFAASVLSCDDLDDGRYRVFLDETYFYPESGGQTSDRGTIAGVDVVDVQEVDDGRVSHIVTAAVALGRAEGRIDAQRRFDHMQHHSGQHVLSRAFIEVAGLETVSFHMGDDACTIDLQGGRLTDAVALAAETLANDIVFQNREVHIRNVAAADLDSEALRRKLPQGVTEVRLVDIDGFDVCGCCGTHVRRTGELGLIKVLKSERVKAADRVSFKVGRRAVSDFQEKHEIVKSLANKFTTAVEAIPDKVDKLQNENQTQRKENKRLNQRLAEFEARGLVDDADSHDGRRYVVRFFADASSDYLRALSAVIKSMDATVSVLGNASGTVVCNAADGVDIDFQAWVVEPARALGGSGGGKAGFASVRLPEASDVVGFLDGVYKTVREGE